MKKPPTAPAASASTAAGASELALRLSSALWGPLLMHNAERAARLLRHAPGMRPEDQGVAVTSGLRYGPEAWRRYDLYRPSDVSGPLPLVPGPDGAEVHEVVRRYRARDARDCRRDGCRPQDGPAPLRGTRVA